MLPNEPVIPHGAAGEVLEPVIPHGGAGEVLEPVIPHGAAGEVLEPEILDGAAGEVQKNMKIGPAMAWKNARTETRMPKNWGPPKPAEKKDVLDRKGNSENSA
jgi:hypothetical protein